MGRILITGATGNVGMEVIRALQQHTQAHTVYAGVRDVTAAASLASYAVQVVPFDFERPETQQEIFAQTDILFLLRPPQLADVKTYFTPLIARAKACGVQHIVFLSVQGVERSRVIPHHKIEGAIRASGLRYTFLRPAYFMQNFTTTLHRDLVQKKLIYLPAGRTRFTLIDVADVGAAAAAVLSDPAPHAGKAYELTNMEKYTFGEMAALLSEVLHVPIRYMSPSLLQFYYTKRKEGYATNFILVLIMLHFLPRFQKAPDCSQAVQQLTGKPPATLRAFIEQHKAQLLPKNLV